MITITDRPLRRLVTRTLLPRGSVRCAQVSLDGSKRSPLAVGRRANSPPYHEACPKTGPPETISAARGVAQEIDPTSATTPSQALLRANKRGRGIAPPAPLGTVRMIPLLERRRS